MLRPFLLCHDSDSAGHMCDSDCGFGLVDVLTSRTGTTHGVESEILLRPGRRFGRRDQPHPCKPVLSPMIRTIGTLADPFAGPLPVTGEQCRIATLKAQQRRLQRIAFFTGLAFDHATFELPPARICDNLFRKERHESLTFCRTTSGGDLQPIHFRECGVASEALFQPMIPLKSQPATIL